jgi:hypothetical protein
MDKGNGITKADLKAALSELKTEVVDQLTETMRQIETNLLTEFHPYGKGQQIRLHSLESREALVTERLAIIEERLLHLESRRPPTV